MEMEFIKIISNSVAIINTLILFIFLVFRKNNSKPNLLISGIMLIPALYFINSVLMLTNYGKKFSLFFFFVQFIAVFFTPLVSSYTYALLGKSLRKLKFIYGISLLLGTIPFYLMITYFNWSETEQNIFFSHLIHGPYPTTITIYSILFYSFQQIVFFYLFLVVKKTKSHFAQRISSFTNVKLNYLHNFTKILLSLNLIIVLFYLFLDILFMEYVLLPIIITAVYSFIVYYAFKNNTIFTDKNYKIHLKYIKDNNIVIDGDTYSDNSNNQLYKKIIKLVHQKEILEDSTLNIATFSEKINEPVHKVSKVINNYFHKNFYDLINFQRIEYAKKLLKENNKHTIEGVAYLAGFNSRATFYRAFKKYTNTTPSQFLQRL